MLFIVLFVSLWIFVPRSSLPVLDRRSHFSLGVTDGITKKHEELEEHEGEVTKTEKQF